MNLYQLTPIYLAACYDPEDNVDSANTTFLAGWRHFEPMVKAVFTPPRDATLNDKLDNICALFCCFCCAPAVNLYERAKKRNQRLRIEQDMVQAFQGGPISGDTASTLKEQSAKQIRVK